MHIERVAVVFDDRPRPETTGGYCFRVWERMAEAVHLRPHELAGIRPGQFDLILHIDDGLPRDWPQGLGIHAFWAIDTHLDFERCLDIAGRCDLVFAAQRDGAEQLRNNGIPTAQWLPLACDPEIHGRRDVSAQFDVAFVGHVFPGSRQELLELLAEKFPRSFVGQSDYREMAAIYSSAKIVFNRSLKNDLNMRVFEGLASGALVVTNDLTENGQAELFLDGVQLVTYQDADDLVEKITYYLDDDVVRRQIAAAGRELVLARHTYQHRMQQIRETVESLPQTAIRAVNGFEKDHAYYEFARPELLNLIPTAARRVLDIGCGSGVLGRALKARQEAEVWGIERDEKIARIAGQRLDRVLCADVEQISEQIPLHYFDAIVCGDVLEHLRHPESLLKRVRQWLTSQGQLIISLPNVRHHSVVSGLLQGDWTYEPAGLLDEDHVRFFTRREIEKLLFRGGFEAESWLRVWGPGDQPSIDGGSVRIGRLNINGLTPDDAADYYTYQYLVRAQPARTSGRHGLTSIMLVTHNQLAYTRGCLESVRFRTDEPFELIVIDNGSTDGTVEYLQTQPDVTLIVNGENRGFPAAVNQGLAVAHGRQVLLLNNDALVTTGWLTRMLNVRDVDEHIGLIGPVSNRVSGEQQIAVDYDDLSQLDGFAWEWGTGHAGQIIATDRLVGFCLLLTRQLWEAIGPFDERFGIGNFEDDDYCRRAKEAGFRCAIAVDAFVHHFGSVTFQASGIDFAGLLQENQRKFFDKWNHSERPPTTQKAPPAEERMPAITKPEKTNGQADVCVTIEASGALRLVEQPRPKLSLCMIVRDNERTIDACLASIAPCVDELIVVDTGSLDRTPEIALTYGAKLYHFPWCDDFAAARNESLKYATGEWIFWMDSDDVIPEDCGRKLRALVDGKHPANCLGYVMQVHCPGQNPTDVTVVDHVKLFRNQPELRFEFRIHEQILPAIRRAGGEVAFTDVYVVHAGSDRSHEGQAHKLERDFKLLQLELADRPDHPFVLFNLGMTHADCGQHAEAIRSLERCLAVSAPAESHVRKAYALLVSSLMQSGRHVDAEGICARGRELFADDKELLFRQAMLEHHGGRLEEAAAAYRQLLEAEERRHFTSIDAGLSGYKARHNLAVVLEDLGDIEAAANEWRQVTQNQPDYAPAWRSLGEILLRQGKKRDVLLLCQQLTTDSNESLRHLVSYLQGRIAEAEGDVASALSWFDEADRLEPTETFALRQSCRLLFESGVWPRARESLAQLATRAPDDASVFHNLGVVNWRLGEVAMARSDWELSLSLRPGYQETLDLLENVQL